MRIVIVSFVAALLAIAARPAAADVFNQRNHLVGLRATLMGGAYTAIADDISAAYYNPAGLAQIKGLAFSLSVTGYSYQRFRMTEYYDFSGPGSTFNVDMNRFNPIPTTFGVNYSIFRGRWVIALGVFQLDNVRFAALNAYSANISGVSANETRKINLDLSTFLIGFSTGVKATSWLYLGFSVFYQLYQGVSDTRSVADTNVGVNGSVEAENEVFAGGMVFVVGLKAKLWRDLWLGLAYSSQTLPLHGKNKWAWNVQLSTDPAMSDRGQNSTALRLPHRITLGVAWARAGAFTLSADLIAYLPLDYAAPNSIYAPSDATYRYRERFHVDASLGAQIDLSERWVLHLGFYTNTSGATDQDATLRIHLFGGTIGAGFGKQGQRLHFGLNLSGGRAGRQSVGDSTPVSWRRFSVQVLFGGTTTLLQ
ncbi:MAG: hypothetical protein KC609_18675 [Myxococcales bacterium]|nr:hypothetical protein [Myxococcales bacterium]